jgi:EAL and modified HD-GYP domain-containing signal transduction protein
MSPVESPAYLARQPILDRNRKIFAYELLFRDSPSSDTAVIQNGVQATAQVLENVLNHMGLAKLVGNHKAFINCSREMLLDNLFGPLDSKRFVLEILEDVESDAVVVKAVENYHRQGFKLALDDVVFSPAHLKRIEPFLPYITYAKLDLVGNTPESRALAVPFFKARGIILLAEKVETEKDFKNCLDDGYELFQGFFFAKPQLVTGHKVDSDTAAILHILQILRGEPTLDVIEKTFAKQPEIEHSLLKYINAAAVERRTPIVNVRDAISWIGIYHLQEWLMLMLYARPEMGDTPQTSPLFQNASQRAKFLENLAFAVDPHGELPAKAFITGIMSRMDALVKAPLQTILPEFGVDEEISEALLHKTGRLGCLLRLADAIELDQPQEIRFCTEQLSLTPETLSQSLNAAYVWAAHG